jgi:hypothetical protein
VGGYHTYGAPGLDSLAQLGQAAANAPQPDPESLLHARIWKAASMLFWRSELAQARSRHRRRNMASVAELKKSFLAQIDKVENRASGFFAPRLRSQLFSPGVLIRIEKTPALRSAHSQQAGAFI